MRFEIYMDFESQMVTITVDSSFVVEAHIDNDNEIVFGHNWDKIDDAPLARVLRTTCIGLLKTTLS